MHTIARLSRTSETQEQRKGYRGVYGSANSQLRASSKGRVCVGQAEGGALTVKSKAGMGVQRFTWIMASTLGRWPSLAPAKNSLAERKADQPGMALRRQKEAPSPDQAPSSMPPPPPLPTQERHPSKQITAFPCTSLSPLVTGPTIPNADAGKPEAAVDKWMDPGCVETLSVA